MLEKKLKHTLKHTHSASILPFLVDAFEEACRLLFPCFSTRLGVSLKNFCLASCSCLMASLFSFSKWTCLNSSFSLRCFSLSSALLCLRGALLLFRELLPRPTIVFVGNWKDKGWASSCTSRSAFNISIILIILRKSAFFLFLFQQFQNFKFMLLQNWRGTGCS